MKVSLVRFGVFLTALLATAAAAAVQEPFESRPAPVPESEIDKLVFAKLEQLGIEPANMCSDSVFVRRVYLDVIGTLPTAEEARKFITDETANKRARLIDHLLDREEFADYWAMKWSELLRVKAEFPINLWPNAAQAYHRWIHSSIKQNMPYDKFVREMLTATGSNFRAPQVNFYRAMQNKNPQTIAQMVALSFMGVRTANWPEDRLAGMSAFFSQISYKTTGEWKEEIVCFDADKEPDPNAPKLPARPVFPDGIRASVISNKDPREIFADWLINPKNEWFTRNIANRVWSWLLGRGIIHEPDDIRPDNPASNPELLTYLESELISANYDLKRLYRLILNSNTYQLSSIPASDKPEAEAQFAFYLLRRLEAEVLIDALNQITGSTDKYSSAVPEPFTFIPEEQRAIQLADGSITSSFLEMFGRPPRDTGLESERSNRPTADQSLHMLNSSHIQRKIEQGPKLRSLLRGSQTAAEIINGIYLTIVSRFPTEDECKTMAAYAGPDRTRRREAVMDLIWALVNSAEFLYRH
ncbi:MAG TPA: DUF1553 domain-containing protein [Sedimentisphaerales bacterium]|nr:DUF1553 domain-containing protein [Sedimentisphaerales bacterium]